MYKSKLQELCHKKDWDLPVYSTAKDGPDHCPNFMATVKVGGQIFESPANVCKSSKEAQNLAAKIAFDHLDSVNYGVVSVSVPASDINPPSPTLLPSPGFLELGNNKKLKQNQAQNDQNSLMDHSLTSYRAHTVAPKDLHVYKNRLQHYAQKKNLNLPEYSCEIDGPPHARRFRAFVKIGGRTFKSPIYFSTLKDSEHAAAKEAFQSLSVGEVQEDEGLYKTLLQELAQKKGLQFPSYTTITIGPPHNATFVSTVEIGSESFEGRECKTKKLSEMNAAKNAYNSLMERGENGKGNTVIGGGSSQPITNHESRVDVAAETHAELAAAGIGEIHSDYGVISSGDVKNKAPGASSPSNLSLDSVTTCDLQQDTQPIYAPSANENDAKAKECSKHGFEESIAEKPDRARTCGSKIVIKPRKSGMKVPADATLLPYSDDKWVAWE